MSQIGDLVVDAGVVFVVTFDGRQSLLGHRVSMEPLIAISGFQRPAQKPRKRRRYVHRVDRRSARHHCFERMA